MDIHGWYTKEDVLHDLAEAAAAPVDECSLVHGSRPPPPPHDPLDNEMEIMLGDEAPAETAAPDLQGISQMLRMVQENTVYDNCESPSSSTDYIMSISKVNPTSLRDLAKIQKCATNNLKSSNASSSDKTVSHYLKPNVEFRISKSQLNPNVKEYVPLLSQKIKATEASNAKEETAGETLILAQPKANAQHCNITQPILRNEIDATVHDYDKERQELAAMLWGCEGAGERFRCRSKKSAAADRFYPSSSLPKVELRTPSYFQNHTASDVPRFEAEVTADAPVPSGHSETRTAEEFSQRESDADAASVSKVSDWLARPSGSPVAPVAPPPAPHLGPVTCKRKERAAAPSGGVARGKLPKSSAPFVPSELSLALVQRFEERARALQAAPATSVWERLQQELEKRDAIVRRRAPPS